MAAPIELPQDIRLEYLAEGAANIVYRILPQSVFHSQHNSTTIAANTADVYTLPSENGNTTPPPSEIEPSPSIPTATPQDLSNKLLRLHKNVPWIPSYSNLHDTYIKKLAPLFDSSHLITQTLILLPPQLLFTCNTALRTVESSSWLSQPHTAPETQIIHSLPRPTPRHGSYLDTSDLYGLLIEDMSPRPESDELLLELKPKWLAQSPTAPKSATRCRTCALRAMRDSQRSQKQKSEDQTNTHARSVSGRAGKKAEFCPLDLVSAERGHVDAAVAAILAAQLVASHELQLRNETIFNRLKRCIVDWMIQSPLLHHLRDLQVKLDTNGVLGLGEIKGKGEGAQPDLDFLLATTLRDCTLFLRLTFLAPEPPPGRRQISGERIAVGEAGVFGEMDGIGGLDEEDRSNAYGWGWLGGYHHDDGGLYESDDDGLDELDGQTISRGIGKHTTYNSDGNGNGNGTPLTVNEHTISRSPSPTHELDNDNDETNTDPRPDTGPALHITAKLGDLDLKEAEEGKVKYWSGLERDLIEGGWYQGLDGAVVGCMLERGCGL